MDTNKFESKKLNIIADNDPKHTSAVCREAIENNDINWIPMPPYSPRLQHN
jgi:hypothetical protein